MAFNNAIAKRRLFAEEEKYNWAGNYMYMFSDDIYDHFKHIDTRNYVKVRMM
jgi:hypothetical protein